MNKQFLFWVLIGMALRGCTMELPIIEEAFLKLHIFNKVEGEIFALEISKFWLDLPQLLIDQEKAAEKSEDKEKDVEIEPYKVEDVALSTNEGFTTNMRYDSYGIIKVRYGEQAHKPHHLLAIRYTWNLENQKVGLHIDPGTFGDMKSLNLNPRVLAPSNNVALVLKGKNLADSYFYYPRMPQED